MPRTPGCPMAGRAVCNSAAMPRAGSRCVYAHDRTCEPPSLGASRHRQPAFARLPARDGRTGRTPWQRQRQLLELARDDVWVRRADHPRRSARDRLPALRRDAACGLHPGLRVPLLAPRSGRQALRRSRRDVARIDRGRARHRHRAHPAAGAVHARRFRRTRACAEAGAFRARGRCVLALARYPACGRAAICCGSAWPSTACARCRRTQWPRCLPPCRSTRPGTSIFPNRPPRIDECLGPAWRAPGTLAARSCSGRCALDARARDPSGRIGDARPGREWRDGCDMPNHRRQSRRRIVPAGGVSRSRRRTGASDRIRTSRSRRSRSCAGSNTDSGWSRVAAMSPPARTALRWAKTCCVAFWQAAAAKAAVLRSEGSSRPTRGLDRARRRGARTGCARASRHRRGSWLFSGNPESAARGRGRRPPGRAGEGPTRR